jgi:hypothetical protein
VARGDCPNTPPHPTANFDGLAVGRVASGPVYIDEIPGRNELAGFAIKNVEKAVLRRMQEDFAFLSVDCQVGQDRVLIGVVVPSVRGRALEVPGIFAGVDIQCDHGRRVQIVFG